MGNPKLEVKPTGQHGCMAIKSGLNIFESKKYLCCQYFILKTKRDKAMVTTKRE